MKRQAALYLSFALILLVLAEVLSQVVLVIGEPWLGKVRRVTDIYKEQTEYIHKMIGEEGGRRREILDPELGWRYRPGYRKDDDVINSQGLRSEREYSSEAGKGILRIAAFGDSFVYGNEVGTADAWSSQMEQACKGIEVLNYGIGGYGVDQAFLRYESEGAAYAPDVVLIGFVADDLRRLVNVYRRFIDDHELPLFKPRFLLQENTLRLVPNPFPRVADYRALLQSPEQVTSIGRHDYFYQSVVYENALYDLSATVRLAVAIGIRFHMRYLHGDALLKGDQLSQDSEAFKIQVALFQKFVSSVNARHASPYIVTFPQREDVERLRAGQGTTYDPLVLDVQERMLPHIDLAEAFRQHANERVADLFMSGGHYSGKANQIVSEHLLKLFGCASRNL